MSESIIALVNGNSTREVIENTTKVLEEAGFQLKEQYGTLCFATDISFLGEITEDLARVFKELQLERNLFVAISSSHLATVLDPSERLEAMKWWEVSQEPSELLMYDLRLSDNSIDAKKNALLQRAGALRMFDSCYYITKDTNLDRLQAEFQSLVQESKIEDKECIEYHAKVFKCHIIGDPEVIDDWAKFKASLLVERLHRIYHRLEKIESDANDLAERLDNPINAEEIYELSERMNAIRSSFSRVASDFKGVSSVVDRFVGLGLGHIDVNVEYEVRNGSSELVRYDGDIKDIIGELEATLSDTGATIDFVVNAVEIARLKDEKARKRKTLGSLILE
jgi:hypothetical protein